MAILVKGPGAKERVVEAAEDMDVDDIGTLVLTSGEGRSEQVVYLAAAGAWATAERQ